MWMTSVTPQPVFPATMEMASYGAYGEAISSAVVAVVAVVAGTSIIVVLVVHTTSEVSPGDL